MLNYKGKYHSYTVKQKMVTKQHKPNFAINKPKCSY